MASFNKRSQAVSQIVLAYIIGAIYRYKCIYRPIKNDIILHHTGR